MDSKHVKNDINHTFGVKIMTKREIASLVIKLMGVFILLKTIGYAPMAFSVLFTVGRAGWNTGFATAALQVVGGLFLMGLALGWAVLIIVLSDKFARWLIKEDKPLEMTNSMNKEEVMVIAISCIGLYFTVAAIPSIIFQLSNFLSLRRAGTDYSAYWSGGFHRMLTLIAPVVQIALGLWLFAGSKGIVKLWKKIRS
jgi:hypothetical protein